MKSYPFPMLLLLGCLATGALAQTGTQPSGNQADGPGQGGQGRRPHRPPPEAIAACQGKAAGAACSFTGRENQPLAGTCFAPPAHPPGGAGSTGTTGVPGGAGNGAPQGSPPLACRPAQGGPGMGSGNQNGQGRAPKG